MRSVKIVMKPHEILTAVHCDMCKNQIQFASYERDRATIYHEHGEVYPEGGFLTKEEYDICPECFAKVDAFVRSFGAEPTVTERDV